MQGAVAAPWVRWGRAHRGMLLVALVVVYFLAAKLGLHFAFVHASASAVWPPTGIALAAMLLFGRGVWPAIFLGAFLVNASIAGSIASSIGVAIGNTLEALVGAFLVERYAGGAHAFDRAATILRFLLLAGMLSTAVSATIGAASLVATGEAESAVLGAIWLTWWLGDAAGALLVAPLLLLWSTARFPGPLRERPMEAVVLLVVVAATGAAVFGYPGLNRYPLPFLCIPPLIWAAFRFGQREVATAAAVLSTIATAATVSGAGPFAMGSDNESLLLLQAFLATTVALTLPVAALVWERKAIAEERSHLLERESAARAEAEAANRAKDAFMAMLSHELRNPLAAISSSAQVLQAPGTDHAFSGRAVDIISRQTAHLARLIEDLLDVARVTHGKIVLARERVDLAETVRSSLSALRCAGRLEQHRIVTGGGSAWTDADPARISQIVDNLLVNAIKYTPAGGRIDIETMIEGEDAVLRVRDTGIGIAPELLPHVFELFTQGPRGLDRAQGGLGIGLTLAQRLAQAHGGRIDATSDGPAKGSTFTVRLPRANAPGAETGSRREAVAAAYRTRRILIIEDDEDCRDALHMQLRNAGHEVFAAATGTEGIAIAARVKPDIVLLDIGLPGTDGYEVARRLRENDGCPLLIAITGYGLPKDQEQAIRAGIDVHLVKPVDTSELRRLLL